MERIEFIRLDAAKATRTPEGWIRDRPVLTRAGVFTYRNPNGTVRREFRPPEEVFSATHLASMQGAPITTAENHNRLLVADEEGTVIGAIASPGTRMDENSMDCVGDIVIYQPGKLGTRRELSLGYRIGRLDETPGEWQGQRYDAVQRDLVVNHCAVVPRGRAGNARLRLDAEDAVSGDAQDVILLRSDEEMADAPTNLVSVRLDSGIEYKASPEVAHELATLRTQNQQLRTDAAAEKGKADAAAAERDTLKLKLKEAEDKLPQLRTDALNEAKQRLALEGAAQKHGVEFRADMADRAIMEAITTKLRPGMKFEGQPDAYVKAAFDMVVADAVAADQAAAGQRAAVNGVPQQTRSDAAPQPPQQPIQQVPGQPPVARSAREAREIALRAGALY